MHFLTYLVSLFLVLSIPSPLILASKDAICDDTPFPQFCKSLLPSNDSFSIHDYGRFSINQSISSAKDLMSSVQGFLDHQDSLSETMIHALEDCRLLESSNIDLFSKTLESISLTDSLASSEDEDDLLTSLSAAITNQQTCSDGLVSISSPSNPVSSLQAPLSNGTKLYSVSLAIFRHGWVSATRQSRTLIERKLGRKPTSPGLVLYPGGNVVKVSQTVVVNPCGSGDYRTISEAVAAAPNNSDGSNGFFVIRAVAGVYREYVNVTSSKKYLMMIGDGINNTIITGNRSVVGNNISTFDTATLTVSGQGFVGVNLTIRNTAGPENHQAVAVRSNADFSTFYRCSFEAYQDTLYPHSFRQFYRECDIYGTIDFIFGNAAVVLQNCNIFPRLPLQGQFNAVTAQGRTDINQNTGTSLQNCTITPAENLGSTATYLGRPWKLYSRTVYIESFMDSLIHPAGWSIWSGDFALNTSYYAEFNNRGPGSDTSNRVTWEGFHIINATDATNFTVSSFISGASWLPATGVPYNADL